MDFFITPVGIAVMTIADAVMCAVHPIRTYRNRGRNRWGRAVGSIYHPVTVCKGPEFQGQRAERVYGNPDAEFAAAYQEAVASKGQISLEEAFAKHRHPKGRP